ncbi:MAG: sigma-54 dependent transcriptional regulator [candidate division Zixibacteria bacterium]|nr:sigma-54 dependent transcriptional regulator [candidate division Zixibacteria bacterium]
MSGGRVYIVDDEESMCNFMAIMLRKEGYEVAVNQDPREAVDKICVGDYDLVIADVMMPEMSGLELLTEVKRRKPDQEFIVMTAFASVESAIEAMKKGAGDYITKPFKIDEIKLVINRAISHHRILDENHKLKKQLAITHDLDSFIGVSEPVVKLKELVKQVAQVDSTILIRGESGTGKDLLCHAIHSLSQRCDGPFVSINCAAIPETLLESELFGHGKGAFTGAIRDKEGLFKVADGGTFFLDEIGNTSLGIQVKLLRVLEEKKITPVGETKPIPVDVRLICATNANIEDEVTAGRFRSDLFYRLNVIPVHIPPLRERVEDIPLLVDYFVDKFCSRHNQPHKEIQPEVYNILSVYGWPGNVRELENTIERAVLLTKGYILTPASFPEPIVNGKGDGLVNVVDHKTPTLESIEQAYIHWVLEQTGGNKSKAARMLGIDASTLYRKLEKYKIGQVRTEKVGLT